MEVAIDCSTRDETFLSSVKPAFRSISESLSSTEPPESDLRFSMFGAKGGPTIRNKDSILADVDRALGREKPPAIEYLFVAPFGSFEIFGIKFGSPYGHSAIRYTLPDGTQVVMNIVKNSEDEDKLVNFVDPTEYLYGTQFDDVGAEQGGAYNRQIVGVRIEEWPDDLVCD